MTIRRAIVESVIEEYNKNKDNPYFLSLTSDSQTDYIIEEVTKSLIVVRDTLYEEYHRVESERIVKIFNERGYVIGIGNAESMWGSYSDEYFAAGWVGMPDDTPEGNEVLFNICKEYL